MRLKIATQRSADDVTGVVILDDFKVETPFLTKDDEDAINRNAIPAAQRDNPWAKPVPDELAKFESDAFVLRWTGLRPEHLHALGIRLAEDPPVNDQGEIPYEQELARDIWRYATDHMYSNKIRAHSRQIRVVQYEEKKRQRSPAGA